MLELIKANVTILVWTHSVPSKGCFVSQCTVGQDAKNEAGENGRKKRNIQLKLRKRYTQVHLSTQPACCT